MTLPSTVAHAVQQTQIWLKELADTAGLADEAEALACLRAVLHELRDRLSLEEAVDLGAQLPTLLRGIYYEGFRPHHVHDKDRTAQHFLDAITVRLKPRRPAPEPVAKAVLAIVAHHCDPGEIADVIGQLPAELKELWPLTARTYRERMRGG